MPRTRAASFVILALVMTACSSAGGTSASRYTALVDAKQPSGQPLNLFGLTYFPNELSAHPGDTVDFKVQFSGEPHTVTFGTLVDADLAAFAKLGPQGPAPGAPPLPEQTKLPVLISDSAPPVLSQSAGQPCFLSNGLPDPVQACTKDQQKQPEFDGTQTFYNSGFMPQDAVFSVKIAEGAKPGSYGFMCLLHREVMQGKLTVVDKGQSVPTPAETSKKGADQIQNLIQAFQGPVGQAAQATPDKAVAGVLDSTGKIRNAGVGVFGPKEASIPVGGSVTWLVAGPHTITFGGTPADAGALVTKAADGTVQLNPRGGPAGGPPAPAPPVAPPAAPIPYAGGAWDGQGFHSTGLIRAFPPNFYLYTLKFTAAGTYKYQCLVHTDMVGTIKVG